MINKSKKGISLITLVITIVVIIILAAIAILNVTKNNIATKEAVFKNDMKSFDEQVGIAVQTEFITNPDILNERIEGKENLERYSKELAKSKYVDWIVIKKGKLMIKRNHGFTEEQIRWAQEIHIPIEEDEYEDDNDNDNDNENEEPIISNVKIDLIVDGVQLGEDEEMPWTRNDVTAKLSYEDEIPDGYEIQYKLLGEEEWKAATEVIVAENTTVYGRLYDATLDKDIVNTKDITRIDKEPPTIPTLEVIEQGVNHIVVKASGSTDALSGVKGYRFSQEDFVTEEEWNEKTELFVIQQDEENSKTYRIDGIKANTGVSVYAVAVDNVGHISNPNAYVPAVTMPVTNNVQIDLIVDGVQIGENEELPWTRNAVIANISYNGTIPEGYNIVYKVYKNNENPANIQYTTGTSVTITENSTIVACLYNENIDNGDEVGAVTKDVTKIDNAAPSKPTDIEIITREETSLQVKASGSTDAGIGLLGYQYSVNGTNWSDVIVDGTSYTIPSLTANTTYKVYARAVDKLETKKSLPSEVFEKTNVSTLSTYTVAYNKNTTDAVSSMPASQTKVEGKALTLSSNTPTRTGYSFGGWATTASGTKAYDKGGSYTANNGITLYAIWSVNKYTLTLNANGGSVSPTSISQNYGTAITLPTPTRTGYTFNGWYTAASGGNKVTYTTMPATTTIIYAQWTPITYSVKYNVNGGSGTMADTSHTYDLAANLRANTFTREGYEFLGWATSASGDVIYKDNVSVKNLRNTSGTYNLYAVWQRVIEFKVSGIGSVNDEGIFSITASAGGASSACGSSSSYAWATATIPSGFTVYYSLGVGGTEGSKGGADSYIYLNGSVITRIHDDDFEENTGGKEGSVYISTSSEVKLTVSASGTQGGYDCPNLGGGGQGAAQITKITDSNGVAVKLTYKSGY